jgi:hypothetical protein
MRTALTFHIFPNPQGHGITVAVDEGARPAGEFQITRAAWKRLRARITFGRGIRIREYRD